MVRSWKGLRKVHGMEGKKGEFKAGRWVVYRQFSFATRFPGSLFLFVPESFPSPCLLVIMFPSVPVSRLPSSISCQFPASPLSLFSFSCASPFPRTLFLIQPSFSFSWSPLVTFSRSPVLVQPQKSERSNCLFLKYDCIYPIEFSSLRQQKVNSTFRVISILTDPN